LGSLPYSPAPAGSILIRDMRLTPLCRIVLAGALALTALSLPTLQAQSPAPVDPKTVPVIDGGIGNCSAEFTVTDAAGTPVYAATIKVHIAYGFMYLHKLDLQVGTNAGGQARFSPPPKAAAKAQRSTTQPKPAKQASPSLCSENHSNASWSRPLVAM
jgi:hypothetical protein